MGLEKLGHVVLEVRDLARSEAFYTVDGPEDLEAFHRHLVSRGFAGRDPLPFAAAGGPRG